MADRVAIITGGASGIGRATAQTLGAEGCSIVIADIDDERGAEFVSELSSQGVRAVWQRTDVTVESEVQALVARAIEEFGQLDAMINNAGRGAYGPVNELSPQVYDDIIRLNQYGVFYGIHHASRAMIEQGRAGVIVNTCSASGILATPALFAYNTAKAAVTMMTASAAHDLAPHDIRVVGVAPGVTATPITQKYKDAGADTEASYLAKHARKRWITASQIADAIAFLCSDRASAINGTVLEVDDGYVRFK